jgi:hypothetical protein
MKLPVIKKLVETYTLEQCEKAEQQMLEGLETDIAVEGDDDGEKLTHVLGAIEILKQIKTQNIEPRNAIRDFFERVRNSISS